MLHVTIRQHNTVFIYAALEAGFFLSRLPHTHSISVWMCVVFIAFLREKYCKYHPLLHLYVEKSFIAENI